METRRPPRLLIETTAQGIAEIVVRFPTGGRAQGLALLRQALPGLEALNSWLGSGRIVDGVVREDAR